jgi:hypothetical protein
MRRRLQSIGEWVSGGFVLAVTAGLIFTLIDPSLVWFVVLGLVLAGASKFLQKERGDSRVSTLVVLVGSGASLLALAVLLVSVNHGGGGRLAAPQVSIEVPAQLRLGIHYDAEVERLGVSETLTVMQSDIDAAANSPVLRRAGLTVTPRRLTSAITEGLAARDWAAAVTSTLRLRFERSHDQPANRHGIVPAEQTNVVAVPVATVPVDAVVVARERGSSGADRRRVDVRLLLAERSQASIDGPQRALGQAYPNASGSETRPSDKRQFVTLDLDEDTGEVQFEIRSPPFRNEVLVRAVDLTAFTPFGWLLTALIALSSDSFRGALLASIRRLTGRAKAARDERSPRRRSRPRTQRCTSPAASAHSARPAGRRGTTRSRGACGRSFPTPGIPSCCRPPTGARP